MSNPTPSVEELNAWMRAHHLHGFWTPTVLMVAAVPLIATGFIAISISFVQMAPADSRGAAMGVYSTILFLGLGAGPAIFAPLITKATGGSSVNSPSPLNTAPVILPSTGAAK